MLDKNEARKLALNEILNSWTITNDEPIILDEFTEERDFGWVFFYTSRNYNETGDYKYALAGNAPLIINKFDGSIHYTGTALETEHYIREYEKKLKQEKVSET